MLCSADLSGQGRGASQPLAASHCCPSCGHMPPELCWSILLLLWGLAGWHTWVPAWPGLCVPLQQSINHSKGAPLSCPCPVSDGAEDGQDVPMGLSIAADVGWCRTGEDVSPPIGSSVQGAAGQAEARVWGWSPPPRVGVCRSEYVCVVAVMESASFPQLVCFW